MKIDLEKKKKNTRFDENLIEQYIDILYCFITM